MQDARRFEPRKLLFAAVCGATVLAYARSFAVPFQFDDLDQILENAALHASNLEGLLSWGRARLIPYSTFALNWRLGGADPTGYHAVNLAIHLLAAFFVFRLALAIAATPRLRESRLRDHRLVFAASAAFLFACHPIQIQAVTYVVQRVTSMCAMFYVGSVLAYVTARNRQADGRQDASLPYALSILCAAGALLSKEIAVSLPLAILLVEWFFQPVGSLARNRLRLLPFALLSLVVPSIWLFLWRPPARVTRLTGPDATWLDNLLRAASPSGAISSLEYFLTQMTVIPRYLGLVLLPWGFNVDPDIAIAHGWSAPVLGGFVLLAALFVFGLYTRTRWPVLGFGIVWVFVALGVESSVFPIGDPMMEHRMYLPMAGLSIALAALFAGFYARMPILSLATGAVVGAALLALTIARNEVWRTELGLWGDALAKSPGKARPHLNFGTILHQQGQIDAAILHYCNALRIDPEMWRARYNLDLALTTRVEQRLARGEPLDLVPNEDRSGLVPRNPCTDVAAQK